MYYNLGTTDSEYVIIQKGAEIKLTLVLFRKKKFAKQINSINKIVQKILKVLKRKNASEHI